MVVDVKTTQAKKPWDLSDTQLAARNQYRDAIISMKEDYLTFKKQADGKNGFKLDIRKNHNVYITKEDFIKYHAKGIAPADASKAYDTLAGEDGLLKASELLRLFHGWSGENTPQKSSSNAQQKAKARASTWNQKHATKADGSLQPWAMPTNENKRELETPQQEYKRIKLAKDKGKLPDEALFDNGNGGIDEAKKKAFYAIEKLDETNQKHDGWAAACWDGIKQFGRDVFNADWGKVRYDMTKEKMAMIDENFGHDWKEYIHALAYSDDKAKRTNKAEQFSTDVNDYTTNVENGEAGVKTTAIVVGSVAAVAAAPVVVAAAGGATLTTAGTATTAVLLTEGALDAAVVTAINVSDDVSADREIDAGETATNAALSFGFPWLRSGVSQLWKNSKNWGGWGTAFRWGVGGTGTLIGGTMVYNWVAPWFGGRKIGDVPQPQAEQAPPAQVQTPQDTLPKTNPVQANVNFSTPDTSAYRAQENANWASAQQKLTQEQRDSIERAEFFR